MNANLTRSPWRRRPSLFLRFRAASAAADSHAATVPVPRARWSSKLRANHVRRQSPLPAPNVAKRSRLTPVPDHPDTLATVAHQPQCLGLVLGRKRPPLAPAVFLRRPFLTHVRTSRGVHATKASPFGS